MTKQNKKAKYNAGLTNRNSDSEEQYEDDIDDIDDFDDVEDEVDDTILPEKSTKVNTNNKRTRAARELTSFVWEYFKKEGNLAICQIVKDNGIECGHSYKDGSTTSNLIHHLASKHMIFKPGSTEEVIY
jgi:hypothetical protein